MVFTAKRASSASDAKRANRNGAPTSNGLAKHPSRPIVDSATSGHAASILQQAKYSVSFKTTGSKVKLSNQHADEMYYADNDDHLQLLSQHYPRNRDPSAVAGSSSAKGRIGSSSGSSIHEILLSDVESPIVMTGSKAPMRQQRAATTKKSMTSQSSPSATFAAAAPSPQYPSHGMQRSVPKTRPIPPMTRSAAQTKIHTRIVTGKTNSSPDTSPMKGRVTNAASQSPQSGDLWASSSNLATSNGRSHSGTAFGTALHRSVSPPTKSPKTAKVDDFHAKTLQRIAEKREHAREEQQKVINIAKAMEEKKMEQEAEKAREHKLAQRRRAEIYAINSLMRRLEEARMNAYQDRMEGMGVPNS